MVRRYDYRAMSGMLLGGALLCLTASTTLFAQEVALPKLRFREVQEEPVPITRLLFESVPDRVVPLFEYRPVEQNESQDPFDQSHAGRRVVQASGPCEPSCSSCAQPGDNYRLLPTRNIFEQSYSLPYDNYRLLPITTVFGQSGSLPYDNSRLLPIRTVFVQPGSLPYPQPIDNSGLLPARTVGGLLAPIPTPQGGASADSSGGGAKYGWFWERWAVCPPSLSWTPSLSWAEGSLNRSAETCNRFCCGLYDCLCCPDPCYTPRWQPLADSAFDVASVRPITQQRLRWDAGMNLNLPDRSEFFWARADGKGNGPTPAAGNLAASNRVNYQDVSYYFEAAIERFALIVDVPFRAIDPNGLAQSSGIGDIKFGAKSLLFDCELLQVGAQFLVYTPTGSASRGLGTGHYSFEPSLLLGLRLGPDTYLQGQLSEWIPLHGDQDYAGSVLHSHVALNRLLCCLHEDWLLVGTLGFNSWTFQSGEYTDPVLGSGQRAAGFTYVTLGPGMRLFICDRIDIGFAVNLAMNQPHFASPLYTTEFRWRF